MSECSPFVHLASHKRAISLADSKGLGASADASASTKIGTAGDRARTITQVVGGASIQGKSDKLEATGNSLGLFLKHRDTENGETIEHAFRFPRQRKEGGLCLADYVMPGGDSVGVLVTTAGEVIRERAEAYKQAGQFVKSHALQALALETAEAAAEWVHRRLREDWGFPDPAEMTMIQRFQARYRGKRYSFGYPACPALEDQKGIWKLLQPEDIGVGLTEGHMMEPEASVSALVFHHPDAVYFNVGETTG